MCYWIGTKNVRDEMLTRAGKDPEDEIAQLFYKTFTAQTAISFMEYYVAIGKANPWITVIRHSRENGLVFENMRWGFNWSYTDKKTGKHYSRQLINSTCEKAFFVHKEEIYSQRCVVLLDGYFEFFHFSGQVYPHFIAPRKGLFFAGGIYQEQVDTETGEIEKAFSIITTPPNPLAEKLHNNPKAPNGSRMLLLLPRDKVSNYLFPLLSMQELKELFHPLPDETMDAWPVPRFLRKEFTGRINSPDVRQRIEYPELFFA